LVSDIKGRTWTEDIREQGAEKNVCIEEELVIGGWKNCIMGSFISCTLHHIHTIRMIKSKRMKWAGHVTRMGEKQNAYTVLVGEPDGKRPQGRPRRRWVANIKMDLRETGWCGMGWIHLAQDRDQWRALVNTVMNLRIPYNVGKSMSSRATD
jgi:hypothetical protein